MTQNLFIGLEKYAPKEIDPEENFFTTSLAYMINNDVVFRRKFLELLNTNKKCALTDDFKAESQAPYDKSFIDIELRSKDGKTVIFVEAKIQSKARDNQLKKYLDICGRKSKNARYYLAYITFYQEEINSKILGSKHFIGHFFWHDVYAYVSHSKSGISKDFIEFMEAKNMKPIEAISEKEVNSWCNRIRLNSKLEHYLTEISRSLNVPWSFDGLSNCDDQCYLKYKTKNFNIYLGIIAILEDLENISFKEGTYCFFSLEVANKILRKKKIYFYSAPWYADAKPGMIYSYGNGNIEYNYPITKIINPRESKERQIAKLKKFFEDGISKIKKLPEYKKLK